MIGFAYFCDECGATHHEPVEACAHCGSLDITRAATYPQADFEGESHHAFKAYHALSEIEQAAVRERAERAIEQIVQLARGVVPVEVEYLRKRQAS